MSAQLEALRRRLDDRTAAIGVAGLGYVGLPLAVELVRAGFRVTGVDPHPDRVSGILRGESHELVIGHARLIFDTRNATRGAKPGRAKVVRF